MDDDEIATLFNKLDEIIRILLSLSESIGNIEYKIQNADVLVPGED